jgi:hypothetical protein
MRAVKMEDGGTKYSNSMKHQVGSWCEGRTAWYIIETVEAGEVMSEYGIDKVWLHTMREATAQELAQKAEQDTKTSDERISKMFDSLADAFPGLVDW